MVKYFCDRCGMAVEPYKDGSCDLLLPALGKKKLCRSCFQALINICKDFFHVDRINA